MRTQRSEEIATERRRRKPDTLNRINGLKLALPPEIEHADDRHQWHYYWANDVGSRIYDLTHDDDFDAVTLSTPEGVKEQTVKRPVGQNDDGSPVYAHLLRKPMQFHLEDKKARDQGLKDQEAQVLTKPQGLSADDAAATYAVKSNSISRGYTP